MSDNIESKYKIEIVSSSGIVLADVSGKVKARNIHLVRNGLYEASVQINLNELEVLCETLNLQPKTLIGIGSNFLRITRLGRPLFGGQIVYYDTNIGPDSTEIVIRATGFLELLSKRFLPAETTYSATDAGLIAKDLIDDTQGINSLGITTHTDYIQTSVNRDRTYPKYKNIKDTIVELSNVINGFDFEFDYLGKFYVYYPKMGAERDEFEFTFPGNIKKARISTDSKNLVNQYIMRGANDGESQLVSVREDTGSQTSYRLRQALSDDSTISVLTTLQQKGDELLRINAQPLTIIDLTLDGNRDPVIGSYWLGDRVKVIINDIELYSDINDYYQIDEITISVDENDSEDINLKVSTIV